MEEVVTVSDIVTSVPLTLLDKIVTDCHIKEIAPHITEDWQELAPFLNITECEEYDILHSLEPKLQPVRALELWKEVYGPKATYKRLIVTLCSQRRAGTALKLRQLLKKSSPDLYQDPVLNDFQGHLHRSYADFQYPSLLQWPSKSSDSYSELELLECSTNDTTKSAEKQTQLLEKVSLKNLLDNGHKKGRKVVMIEGVAGSGKTTLSCYAMKEWAAGRLFQDIQLLIHVSCSDPDIHFAKEIADIIPYPSPGARRDVVDAIFNNPHYKVCFWFEGCDEAPDTLWNPFLQKFINSTGGRLKIPNASIILTSRPSNFINFNIVFTRKNVIKGFESLDSYIRSCYSNNEAREQKLLKALEMKPELRSLCHLPLNAAILVHIYDNCKDKLPTTRTGLFDPLVRNFLCRHLQSRSQPGKSEIDSIDSYSEDLPPELYESLQRLSRLAFVTLVKRKVVIDNKTLKLHAITESDKKLGFLRESLSRRLNGPTQSFSFLHLSLQEYLGALHVSEMDENDQIEAVETVYKQNPLSPVLTFYAGLTQLKIKIVQQLLTDVFRQDCSTITTIEELTNSSSRPVADKRRKILACVNCMYETQNPKLVENISFNRTTLEKSGDFNVHRSSLPLTTEQNQYSESGPHRLQPQVDIPFTRLQLYPTDCLSIGYFARYASPDGRERLDLKLNACPLQQLEFEALTYELSKPAKKQNVILDIAEINLTYRMLTNNILNPKSCLTGFKADGYFVQDINMLLKSMIKWLYHTAAEETMIEIVPSNFSPSKIYHLTLIVRAHSLNTLCLSSPLFGCHQFMALFCAALKYSRVLRLELNNSCINDISLRLLADAVGDTHSNVTFLSIHNNKYTHNGLKCFLQYLLILMKTVDLCQLVVDSFSKELKKEHNKLVEKLNYWRPHFVDCQPLVLEPYEDTIAQRLAYEKCHARLALNPTLSTRSPHH